MTAVRVGGIDLSLSSTGVAVVHAGEDGGQWRTYRVRSKVEGAGLLAQHRRMRDIRGRVLEALLHDEPLDLAVIEARFSGGLKARGAHDLSGLWWDVVGELCDAGVPVASVVGSTLKVYVLGNGKPGGKQTEVKALMTAAIARNYPGALTAGSHDIADAVGLAAMGARHLGQPVDCLPDTQLRAMGSPLWPDSTSPADPRAAQLELKGA